MKVTLSRSAGFCIGVKRAIEKAVMTAKKKDRVFILGDIVHNETVCKDLISKGIRKIKRLDDGKGKTLIIRAHGAPLSVYKKAEEYGYKIVDATCPMVKEIHEIAKKDEKKGRTVIIIGDRDHDEVLGIKGSLASKALVIDPKGRFPVKELRALKKASVVVQSTQNSVAVASLLYRISTIVGDIRFHDTICSPTKNRQKDAKTLPLTNDAVVVIGSRNSANTKRLYEISRKLNKRTCWISSCRDIDPGILKGAKSVAVLAGASTPENVISDVVDFLEKL